MACSLIVHGTCNDGFEATVTAYGDTPAEALNSGQGKIRIVCASHGGTRSYDDVDPVDC